MSQHSCNSSDFSRGYYEYPHPLAWYRLRWRIREGSIWENIHVLDDPGDVNSAQRPFLDEAGQLHEVASQPLSTSHDLDRFIVHYDSLEPEAETPSPTLLFQLQEGQKFFTIGEYVLRVHPWLIEHRHELVPRLESGEKWLNTRGVRRKVIPTGWSVADTELWVDPTHPKLQGVLPINPATRDMDKFWAVAAHEAQDMRYEVKIQQREEARARSGDPDARASIAFHRLRWEVREGTIQQRIRVLKDVRAPDSEQEPLQTEEGDWHEIADLPATMTPTSQLC